MSTECRDESPMAVAEHIFQLVGCAPAGPTLDGTLCPDLPQRPLLLTELRELLLDRSVSNTTRDVVWRDLVQNARKDAAQWKVAAVGMALPSLRTIARQLASEATEPEDVDNEVLVGFMAALYTIDLDEPNIRPRLCDAAKTAGRRARRIAESHSGRRAPVNESTPPPAPQGHPDFVLADAVAKNVVSQLDAELIGLTRLEDMPLHEAAACLGLTTEAATKRRQRAEPVLCEAVQTGIVSADLSVTITSAAPLQVGTHQASARSRTPSDTQSDSIEPKGGRGAFPGSARIRTPLYPAGRPIPQRHHRGRRVALVIAIVLLVLLIATAANAETVSAAPSSLSQVINNLRNWLIGFLVALATLMATIGGLRYLLAGGDPSEVAKAKSTLKFAAFGYAIAALAPILVAALKSIVGG